MACLLDTNVLLRILQPHHPHHPIAVAAVETLKAQGERLCISPQNLVEVWSVVTRPTQVNGFGWSPGQAAMEVARIQGFFELLQDDPRIHPAWLRLVSQYGVSGRQVHDARLAAVVLVFGVNQILTFNTIDFSRYPGVNAVHPSAV